ncbi:MAG: hypothetical protein ACTSPE_09170 [Candidatus Thorarchaeota archaeon]
MSDLSQYDPVLAPYCPSCGSYKGVGPCQNPSCREYWNRYIEHKSVEEHTIVSSVTTAVCVICGEQATIRCSGCGRAYCEKHGITTTTDMPPPVKIHAAKCAICGEIVCEYCWAPHHGVMVCLEHVSTSRRRIGD